MDTYQKTEPDMLQITDFPVHFCVEQIPDNGEDASLYNLTSRAVLLSVFDGCGGSGARRYSRMGNKTGAYIASRVVSSVTNRWFELSDARKPEQLQQDILQALRNCRELAAETGGLIGRMTKQFPTTMAAAICTKSERGLRAELYWAGDSRVYLLDAEGIAQLTKDDIGDVDAMENLSADEVLTNVINLSVPFTIHAAQVELRRPCLLLAATDGCFGYLPTPMDFEYLLLDTLQNAASPAAWEQALRDRIGEAAGDDYTICGAGFGFGSLTAMKQALQPRTELLREQYMKPLEHADEARKLQLWRQYQKAYYRYANRA